MTGWKEVKQFLDSHEVEYESFVHEPVTTSEEAAKTRPGMTLSQGAKALILEAIRKNETNSIVMVVIPGDKKMDSKNLRKLLRAKDVRFISPEKVLELTGVQVGGVPPLGNIWSIPMIMDSGIFENETIAFNAGDRSVTVIMKSKDLERITKPQIEEISK